MNVFRSMLIVGSVILVALLLTLLEWEMTQ